MGFRPTKHTEIIKTKIRFIEVFSGSGIMFQIDMMGVDKDQATCSMTKFNLTGTSSVTMS